MSIITTLERYAVMSDACKARISKIIVAKKHKKKQIILKPGEFNKKLYFIETGLARVYYEVQQDREVTSWFGYEGGFLCSVSAFLSQKPSREYIETLEDSTLYAIEYDDLQQLFIEFPELNLVFRRLYEHCLRLYDTRTVLLRERNPRAQYQAFLRLYPALGNRVQIGHVASYLNRSISTISHVRQEIAM